MKSRRCDDLSINRGNHNRRQTLDQGFHLHRVGELFLALNFYLSIVISQFATERFQSTRGQAGAAVGMFVIGLLVARFFTGNLLGRVGLAQVLYTGVGLSILASALYFAASSLPLLLDIRFFHGATFGIASTAAATIVANIIPKHRIGEGIGYYGLSMTIASAVGPFLGMMLGRSGDYPVIFGTQIAVAGLAVLASAFMDRENSNRFPMPAPPARASRFPTSSNRRSCPSP